MINVLHCGLSSNRGGIESFLLNINSSINLDKYHFDYVGYQNHPACANQLSKLGASIYTLPSRKNPIKYILWLRNLIKTKYQIVHIHKNSPLDFLPFISTIGLRSIKVIAHSHNTMGNYTAKHSFLNAIGRFIIIHTSDALLACSWVAAKWLYGDSCVVNRNKIAIINNGIILERYKYNNCIRTKVRKELNVSNNTKVIGCIGRFVKQKNQSFALEVLRDLISLGQDCCIIFIGDGELLQYTRNKTDVLGLTNQVIFLGSVNNVEDYLQAMDVLLMPSIYEGLPLTAVEAQAAGLPILMSDSITNEVCLTGLVEKMALVEGHEAWSKRLLLLFSRPEIDRASCNLEGLNEFDAANSAKKLCQIYKQLADN